MRRPPTTPPAKREARRSKRHGAGGFTLLETALATIILGTGVLAILQAQQYFYHQNAWSTQTSTATFLAAEMRELLFRLPRHDPVTGTDNWGPEPGEDSPQDYNDLDDFDGPDGNGTIWEAPWDGTATGPLDSRGRVIPNMQGWSQRIQVHNVDPMDIWTEMPNFSTDMVMVTVTIFYQGKLDAEPMEITSMRWISRR